MAKLYRRGTAMVPFWSQKPRLGLSDRERG
nr:MAG TPA: hypothetical protein [Caudoviricetes sp.]